ncbi:MAG: o-succinylbenzoate synthase [Salinivenus sp.]
MTIDSVDLYRYALPLTAPLDLGAKTISERQGLLIRLSLASGAEGWGEAAPLPGFSPESLERAVAHARRLRERWTGHPLSAETLESVWGALSFPKDAPASVRFAGESAVVEAVAAARDVSPAQLLGARRAQVALNALVRGGSPRDVAEDGRRLRAEGYRAVKLKVGRMSVSADVDRVRALREALGDDVALRLDANRAWSVEEARGFLDGIPRDEISYLEEPVANVDRLPAFVEETGCPVALDETTREQPPEVLAQCPVRAVVLKPTMLGGVRAAQMWAAAAEQRGVDSVVSASYESGVGTRLLVALAAAFSETPAGLSPYTRLATDVLSPGLPMGAPTVDLDRVAGARVVEERLGVPIE